MKKKLLVALLLAPLLALAQVDLYSAGTAPLASGLADVAACTTVANATKPVGKYVCGTTVTVVAPPPPSIKLSGLPATTGDTTGKASITYVLTGKATVWCRRDAYAPVQNCPSPFVLGATTPMPVGPHTLDYYLTTGTATPDTTKPAAASWAWTISAPVVVTPPVVVPPPVVTPPSTATALAALSGSPDGSCASVVPSPTGSGRPINLHRITSTQALDSGGQRCETFYSGVGLVTGHDYWGAFAAGMVAGESLPTTSFDSSMVVMQTHTPAAGDTNPPFALVASGQGGCTLMWNVSYQDNPQGDSQGYLYAAKNTTVHSEPCAAPGALNKYVWHFRSQYSAGGVPSPLFEVWRAKPGGAYEKLVAWTGPNDYNTSQNMWPGYSYPRIGPYKWVSSAWASSSIAWYLTPIYFGEGADRLADGQAALTGY